MVLKQSKIMTTPLPTILEQLEDWIKRVEGSIHKADLATVQALKAAEEAKGAGTNAGVEAAERVAALEDRLLRSITEAHRIAKDALEAARAALHFAHLVNSAQVAYMNAGTKAYNETLGRAGVAGKP